MSMYITKYSKSALQENDDMKRENTFDDFRIPNKCHFFHLEKKLDKVVELVGGGSVINGVYPV